ncbi:MAG: hypothetical protein V3T72_22670 [Thermoanaerobaculia bacterium]
MKAVRIDEMQTGEIDRAGLADRLTWLRKRDRAADELFEKLAELRLRFHLQFGAGSSEGLFGIEDDVPIEPPTLHQVAEQAYDSLVDPGLELPVQRLADLLVHPRRLAAGLERPMRDLGAALDALGPSPSESTET